MDPEKKLAAYRAAKKRRAQIDGFKEKITKLFTFSKAETIVSPEKEELLDQNENPEVELTEESTEKLVENPIRNRLVQAVMLLSWITLYIVFIKLEFGIIFLIVSALFGMYYNTRTGPRDESEVSAYSVFNRNCESIDGTLKAEQFEREIRFGAHSVH